jgi:hypothetical protein
MKKMNNKGQGAMEYLMTYGWAILVVMIVGVVLWQLGVFNPGTGQATVIDFYKIKPLSSGDVKLVGGPTGGDCNLTGVFINAAGTSIGLTQVGLNFQNPPVGTNNCVVTAQSPGGDRTAMDGTTSLTVGQGGTFTVEAICDAVSGSTYSTKVNMAYTSEVGGFQRAGAENGTITGPIV